SPSEPTGRTGRDRRWRGGWHGPRAVLGAGRGRQASNRRRLPGPGRPPGSGAGRAVGRRRAGLGPHPRPAHGRVLRLGPVGGRLPGQRWLLRRRLRLLPRRYAEPLPQALVALRLGGGPPPTPLTPTQA